MKQKCKICGEKTTVGFNIDFKLVPICESCATTIFLQQATWYAKNVVLTSEIECKESPTGKHEFVLPPDSFDKPYCKHCYKS